MIVSFALRLLLVMGISRETGGEICTVGGNAGAEDESHDTSEDAAAGGQEHGDGDAETGTSGQSSQPTRKGRQSSVNRLA